MGSSSPRASRRGSPISTPSTPSSAAAAKRPRASAGGQYAATTSNRQEERTHDPGESANAAAQVHGRLRSRRGGGSERDLVAGRSRPALPRHPGAHLRRVRPGTAFRQHLRERRGHPVPPASRHAPEGGRRAVDRSGHRWRPLSADGIARRPGGSIRRSDGFRGRAPGVAVGARADRQHAARRDPARARRDSARRPPLRQDRGLQPGGLGEGPTRPQDDPGGHPAGTPRAGQDHPRFHSGNTGIALAMIGAAPGYPVELVMPANVSRERKQMVAAFGARAIFSDPLEGSDGAIRLCREVLAADPGRYFKPDQYNNEANPLAHYETTGPEIWRQTGGRVTHFVAGIGTGGTNMGTGRFLKSKNPELQVIAVEPEDAFHGLEGLKHMASSIVPGIYHEDELDLKLGIATDEAYDMVYRLGREEALLVGQSCGAAYVAALRVARTLREGTIVVLFADFGDRYLSTNLWLGWQRRG